MRWIYGQNTEQQRNTPTDVFQCLRELAYPAPSRASRAVRPGSAGLAARDGPQAHQYVSHTGHGALSPISLPSPASAVPIAFACTRAGLGF